MSSSLYGQYIAERLGKDIIESDKGFATYFFLQDGVYIEDIFVHKDHRRTKEASNMADKIAAIAKEKGFKKMYGSITPSAKFSTLSLKVLLAYGFQLAEAHEGVLLLVKEI